MQWGNSLVAAFAVLLISPQAGAEKQQASATPKASPEAASDSAREALVADAKRLFYQGNELRKTGDYERALVFYMRSRNIVKSVPNTMNAALCLAEMGRYDEAHELYEQLVTAFRAELSTSTRDQVAQEMTRLRAELGSVDVRTNVESTLSIDGRPRGRLPSIAAVRLLPGPHLVRVTKDGYSPVDRTVEVKAGQARTLTIKLIPLNTAGQVSIDDPALTDARVFVDDAPVGVVPWQGTLEPGEHRFALRKGSRGSALHRFVVVKGQQMKLTAKLKALGPELDILPDPPDTLLTIDNIEVGSGRWRGRLPVGRHILQGRAEGYHDKEEAIHVSLESASSHRLRLDANPNHLMWHTKVSGHAWIEALGSLAIVDSLGSGAEDSCDTPKEDNSLSIHCPNNPLGLGFMTGGRIGYELPMRLSMEFAAGYFRVNKNLDRDITKKFEDANTRQVVYDIQDRLRVSGAFAGVAVGYRLPLAPMFDLRAHLMLGAMFTFSNDRMNIRATVTHEPEDGPIRNLRRTGSAVDNGEFAGGVSPVALPSLDLTMRLGVFRAGLGLSAFVVGAGGPEQKNRDLQLETNCAQDEIIPELCQPGVAAANAEQSYSLFVALMPSLSAGFVFDEAPE